MLRRALATIVTAAIVATAAPAAFAQSEDAPSGSLAQQLILAADESLGADAAVAVVRAYDRGYDLLQIIEALFEGLVAPDCTITDEEDGGALAPFREPSNVIEENATSSVRLVGTAETIALDALERGIQKTTNKLDEQFDFEGRAEAAGVSKTLVLTMLDVLLLFFQGYSPEQIIVDGFIGGGIKGVPGPPGALLVDENGKRIKPDGVEESPEQEEAADQIDAFVGDIIDTLTGIPPSAGADTDFKTMFRIEVEIAFTGDTTVTVTGRGRLGFPRDKKLRGYVVGNGEGKMQGKGECSLSEGGIVGDAGPHPYEVDGPVKFGFSGAVDDGKAKLRIGLVEVDAVVTGDDSFCVDLVRDLAGLYETLTFGPIDLRLRDGASGTAQSTFGDAAIDVKVTLST